MKAKQPAPILRIRGIVREGSKTGPIKVDDPSKIKEFLLVDRVRVSRGQRGLRWVC
jgi:hypothetical protein